MFNFLLRLFGNSNKTTPTPLPVVLPKTDIIFAPSFTCNQPYVIIDTETTGLEPEVDQIIQLSALRFTKDGQPNGAVNTYLNPGQKIPPRASQINGITDHMVAHAPTAEQVKEDFIAFTSDHLIIGYNVTFDLRFLCRTFGDAFRRRDYLDVLSLAREFLYPPDYKLKTVSSYIGFRPKDGFHDSLSDCEATAMILLYLGQLAKPIESWIYNFHGGQTEAEKKKQAEWRQWCVHSQALYLQGETARKEGRIEDALRFYDQAKAACDISFPFLFESYAMAYRKQRDYQNEIRILDEGIDLFGEKNCPTLVERRDKAIKKQKIAEAAELDAEEKARKRAERAERKQRRLEEAEARPKQQLSRPILKLDDEGTILEEFPSVSAAERAVGIDAKGIRNAASGKQKHAGGFRWMYKVVEPEKIDTPAE